MGRSYQIWDVFTDKPLGGNPLAVVLESEGLDSAAMQAIAGEFNLSETTFVAPPTRADRTAAVRIFTPRQELPFAGHPTVGTALALAALGRASDGTVTLELPAGRAVCEIADGPCARAAFDAPALPAIEPGAPTSAAAAAILGVPEEAVVRCPVRLRSGPLFTAVGLMDASVLGAIQLDTGTIDDVFGTSFNSIYVVAKTAEGVQARMFAPSHNITEDPATGSAAVAYAALLAADEAETDTVVSLAIRQGIEMGRPSTIALQATIEGGRLTKARIGGAAVKVAEGKLLI